MGKEKQFMYKLGTEGRVNFQMHAYMVDMIPIDHIYDYVQFIDPT
jgi:hypothetical protein